MKNNIYDRVQNVRLDQPIQFMLICKLLQVPPMRILNDFMTNVGGDSFKKSNDGECRNKAMEYFIQCGYGQDFYNEQDIRQMFKELNAIGLLWPETNKEKLIEFHAGWRDRYYKYWYKKWFRKIRRKQ